MKVKITYTDQEKQQADKLAAICVDQLSDRAGTKVKYSDRHKPYYHIYISDREQEKPDKA